MNEVPRQKLAELVKRFGRDICDDARRCEALLRDVCGDQYRREVFVLVAASKERVASEIAAGVNGIPKQVLLTTLTNRLCNNLGLAEPLARWSVLSWALALNVVQPNEITFPFKCPACGHGTRAALELAGKRVRCPKCNAEIQILGDGREFKLIGQAEGNSVRPQPAHPPARDDPFADEASITPEEMLRQAIRRVLADGVVTEEEKVEVQTIRRALGVPIEVASRIFADEKSRAPRGAQASEKRSGDRSDSRVKVCSRCNSAFGPGCRAVGDPCPNGACAGILVIPRIDDDRKHVLRAALSLTSLDDLDEWEVLGA